MRQNNLSPKYRIPVWMIREVPVVIAYDTKSTDGEFVLHIVLYLLLSAVKILLGRASIG